MRSAQIDEKSQGIPIISNTTTGEADTAGAAEKEKDRTVTIGGAEIARNTIETGSTLAPQIDVKISVLTGDRLNISTGITTAMHPGATG